MQEFLNTVKQGFSCRCPKCGEGKLYPATFDLTLNDRCAHCGLDLAQNDSADGPAVFLIFILSFAVVPLALIVDALFDIPLWVHAILWGVVCVGATLLTLKPLKSYVILLQYKYRRSDWEE